MDECTHHGILSELPLSSNCCCTADPFAWTGQSTSSCSSLVLFAVAVMQGIPTAALGWPMAVGVTVRVVVSAIQQTLVSIAAACRASLHRPARRHPPARLHACLLPLRQMKQAGNHGFLGTTLAEHLVRGSQPSCRSRNRDVRILRIQETRKLVVT